MYYVHFPFIVFFSFSGIWDMMPYYEDIMAKRLERYENLSIREQKVRVSEREREREEIMMQVPSGYWSMLGTCFPNGPTFPIEEGKNGP